jgi:hypothetical protein
MLISDQVIGERAGSGEVPDHLTVSMRGRIQRRLQVTKIRTLSIPLYIQLVYSYHPLFHLIMKRPFNPSLQ